MYPIGACCPKVYGLPQIKKDTPLRPIASSKDLVTYGVDKIIARILKPLVGKSQHHMPTTKDFVEQIKDITLGTGECIIWYDITALFTSAPVASALNIVQNKSEEDQDLHLRTKFTA